MATVTPWPGWGRLLLTAGVALVVGCAGNSAPTEPEAKTRLNKVLRLYLAYAEKHKKGPPHEQALREFGQKLSAKEREDYLIGDDLDGIFTSPRDNQKYTIRYHLVPDPGGASQALAWEATGQDGKRFVALTVGYVAEYDEETFKEVNK